MDDITLLGGTEIELRNMLNLPSMFSKKMTCSNKLIDEYHSHHYKTNQ